MPGTAAIRLGVAVLGAVGFALSYDALRQMAVAIHIRGLLTYTFPLVIDGFIAIGVGALLILRTAPLGSRLYVWVLVGIATTTSIWANALHAIRLNQQTRNTGLHLDDITVGVLSAIAPLALAGSVHLYLVIRRHPLASHTDTDAPKQPSLAGHFPSEGAADAGSDVAERSATVADRQGAGAKPRGRQPSATMDELLAIGRNAPRGRDGRISRRAVESEIRAKGHSVGKDRVADATRMLQAELNEAR
ncbi:DUF2637 domain-containing protein [Streptomyces sp. AK02-01A]|uniref:DUF2637 domain-containing protein n=1 Tax=Streptomyces sp. AK02-01A TaxID=3028648 RepID=UPI0029AC54C6|nr:DUF2637 domain-containing protein [Streptomyces sp. AK02-01A]MDX3854206.1 DUF2637 domain-containing protein [Streptomyces sp. AK02-01A]